MKFINNNKNKAGEKLENYSIDTNLMIYSNYGDLIMKIVLYSVIPISLEGVTTSSREGENYFTSQMTLAYAYFDIKE